MSNSWDNVLLPPGYAFGFTGGPAFDTRITRMDGGGEQRVQVLDEPIWRWSATRKNYQDEADVNGLTRWFLARRGALYGWLFPVANDFTTHLDGRSAPTALDQIIGYGDGTTTRFPLRKQYPDPGGMTARAHVRSVVPLTGAATGPLARLFGIDQGDDLSPAFAAGGVVDSSATVLPLRREVELSSAPALGVPVTWGGYHATVVRFSENTDQGLDATIAGFLADEAPFEVESIPYDDPVPLVPGGSPYGHVDYPDLLTNIELSGRAGYFYTVEPLGVVSGYLDDLDAYPTGGPHIEIQNYGAFTFEVRDSLGSLVGGIAASNSARLFVKDDGSGNRVPWLVP